MSDLNINDCEKEPIHIPGLIQSHGLLFAVSEEEFIIEQVSANVREYLGYEAQALLGKPFMDLMVQPGNFPEFIKKMGLSGTKSNCMRIKNLSGTEIVFEIIPHRYDDCLIFELELYESETSALHDVFNIVGEGITNIQKTKDLMALCKRAVTEVQRLTGFDRVMIYRFDEAWNGTVIAEELSNPSIDSYKGHRFPASDIPAQAREMFYLNWLRSIPSVNFTPSPLIPSINPRTKRPINLSKSFLRSPSPVHLEYLRNMEVGGTLTISILNENKLWGLIACHHALPKKIKHAERVACQFLGQVLSTMISSREVYEDFDYAQSLERVYKTLLSYMDKEEDFVSGLIRNSPNLLDLTSANGAAAAVYFEGKWTVIGKVPRIDEINALVRWLRTEYPDQDVFHTDSLPSLFPDALRYKDIACGLLAISIPKSEENYVFWFRPEVIQTVTWAGNPEKSMVYSNDQITLHPRKSFETWKQTLSLKAMPWKQCEIKAATSLRGAIIEHDLERQFRREQAARKEAEQEKRRVVFLSETSVLLSSTLDFDKTLESITTLSTAHFSDWCIISLKDEYGNFICKGLSHSDPQGDRIAKDFIHVLCSLDEAHEVFQLIEQGKESLLIPSLTPDWLDKLSSTKAYRDFLEKKIAVKSMIIVPLIVRNELIGILQFIMAESLRRFSTEDQTLADEIGRRSSAAIDNSRLYHQSQELLKAARLANEAKEEVLAIASHDLKNPLSAIMLSVQFARRIFKQGDNLKTLNIFDTTLTKVERSAQLMQKLIQELLDIAKIESDRLPIDKQEHLANELINDAYDLFEPITMSKGLRLERRIDDHSCKIMCDRERILQVFSNLIGNAVKFTSPGGVITISLDICDKVPRFSVRDTGSGIEPNHLPHIFDRFWQAKQTAKQGTGLGLAISKGIIEAHDGSIWVKSKRNDGTIFFFTIPANC